MNEKKHQLQVNKQEIESLRKQNTEPGKLEGQRTMEMHEQIVGLKNHVKEIQREKDRMNKDNEKVI